MQITSTRSPWFIRVSVLITILTIVGCSGPRPVPLNLETATPEPATLTVAVSTPTQSSALATQAATSTVVASPVASATPPVTTGATPLAGQTPSPTAPPAIPTSTAAGSQLPSPTPLTGQTPTTQPPVAATGLPLMYPIMSQAMADHFNSTAHPNDLALFLGNAESLIPSVHAGKKVMVYKSWAVAQQDLPRIVGQIDLVAYNPEHNSPTPASELNNLVATVQSASAFSHKYGLKLMVVPDRPLDDQYASQLAPYSDIYVLQGQRLESSTSTFAGWVQPKVRALRAANPSTLVYVQVGTGLAPPQQMLVALQTVNGQIDGIGVWTTSAEPGGQLEQFQGLIRPE